MSPLSAAEAGLLAGGVVVPDGDPDGVALAPLFFGLGE
jgi:hypothetical protein